MAILLSLAGVDSKDKSTSSKQKKESDYQSFRHKLFVKRIGVEKKQQGSNQYMHSYKRSPIDLIKFRGTVVEIDYLDAINELLASELKLCNMNLKKGLIVILSSRT
jgi:amidase